MYLQILFLIDIITIILVFPIFKAKEVIITYGIKPIDICSRNPVLWKYIKIIYIITFLFSNIVLIKIIIQKFLDQDKNRLTKPNKIKKIIDEDNKLKLLIGYDLKENQNIYLAESGLYQNFLITGTIGSGKTSSAMYPFTKQLIEYNFKNSRDKIGMLILDVKGNYYKQVSKYTKKFNQDEDLITIELNGKYKYNPLHKPNLKASVLANRLKTILNLFSENHSESYWIDKAEQVLTEAIKLCRLYNNNYVTFVEIHKLVTDIEYYKTQIEKLRNKFMDHKFNKNQVYELSTALDFFQNEYERLDERTKAILKSEITRITNTFISDYDVMQTFCSTKEKLNFNGFSDAINNGKIVVLNMNIADYKNLSKIIAAYLKLDFQSEIMSNLSKNKIKKTAFICDEYAEYVTKTDSEFFSLSREAKCINIISTQSYSSIKNTLKDDTSTKVICQNLINKIWYRTDDVFTIEEAQKQLGKEDKIKTSKNISENAKETKYSYISKMLKSRDSNISESYNIYKQQEFAYDTNYFTQKLETFTSLVFLSDGNKILKPKKLQMFPYFKER